MISIIIFLACVAYLIFALGFVVGYTIKEQDEAVKTPPPVTEQVGIKPSVLDRLQSRIEELETLPMTAI